MTSSILLVSSSIIYALLLGFGLLFYKFVFPKKNLPLIIVFILISFLPIISIFRPGIYESGDLTFHIIESMVFYKSLMQGILFPIWSGDMNFGYGYPAFLFFYQLPFYIASFFHFIGFSFINSMKLLLATSFILSGVFMYLWLKLKVKEYAAFTGGLFYLFAPYHLVDLHFRVAVGEVLAFVFLPLILFSFEKYILEKKAFWILVEILSFSFLILSHPAISLSGILVLFIYISVRIFQLKEKKEIVYFFILQSLSLIIGIGLTSFYLIPLILESKYTLQEIYSVGLSFVKVNELFYSPWRWGLLFQGPSGQLSYLVGYGQIFIFFLSVFLLMKNKIKNSDKAMIITSLCLIISLIFFMIDVSEFIWRYLPLFKNFQFTYRLLGVTFFIFAILAAFTINNVKNKFFIYFLCLFIVLSTILNWGNRRNLPEIKDKHLEHKISSIVFNGGAVMQAATVWSDPIKPFADKAPLQNLEILNGNGEIKNLERKINYHKYLINAETPLVLKENTLYFPGWEIYSNRSELELKILKNNNPPGVIGFSLPKGIQIIEVKFEDTLARKNGKLLTLLSFICLIFFMFIVSSKKKYLSIGN